MQKEKDEKENGFTEEDRQQLIEFYKEHTMLWNPDENQLGSRYTVDKIQQEWHNRTTYFDREHMRMEGSKKSGAGTDEV